MGKLFFVCVVRLIEFLLILLLFWTKSTGNDSHFSNSKRHSSLKERENCLCWKNEVGKKVIKTSIHACDHAIPDGNTNDIDRVQTEQQED